MTDRKKKGVGFLISGGLFIGMGAVLVGLQVTPDWVVTAMGIIGLVANALGFVIVYPDKD